MRTRRSLVAQWDRVSAVVLVAAGLLALLLGYIGVSNSEFVAAQLPYFVSGGLLGIFFLGAAGVLWLSADLRDEWVKLEVMDERLERIEQCLTAGPIEQPSAEPAPSIATEAVADHSPPRVSPAAARRLAKART